jgi:uncharacterized protein YuzE
MIVSYDEESDALYICFADVEVSTRHLTDQVSVDCDAEGRVAGIEILDASRVVVGVRTAAYDGRRVPLLLP